MGDADSNFQPSKKRAAGVQLSRDNPGLDDSEEISENEAGSFKRASDDVLATRRIVKVRRQTSSTPSAAAAAPASNPFAAIRLIPTAPAVEVEVSSVTSVETEQIDSNDGKSEDKVGEAQGEPNVTEEKTDVIDNDAKQSEREVDESKAQPDDEKDKTDEISKQNLTKSVVEEAENGKNSVDGAKNAAEGDHNETQTGNDLLGKGNEEEKSSEEATTEKNPETASFSSFQQLSSNQNAFSGLAGTGFPSSPFSFGSAPKDGSSIGSLFGLKNQQPTFGFGVSTNGDSSVFGTSGANIVGKSEGSKFPPKQEVPLETGEENEKAVFTADSVLFEFTDGVWKERGKGELKVNIPTSGTGKARLVMRARGNYRLILNASLFPDMKLTDMEKKGITFACINSAGEGKDGLSTIALKFKDPSIVKDFRAAVMEHKAETSVALKTPENSPKASDE